MQYCSFNQLNYFLFFFFHEGNENKIQEINDKTLIYGTYDLPNLDIPWSPFLSRSNSPPSKPKLIKLHAFRNSSSRIIVEWNKILIIEHPFIGPYDAQEEEDSYAQTIENDSPFEFG